MIHSNWVLKLKVLWHVERDRSADGCRARTSSTGRAVKCVVYFIVPFITYQLGAVQSVAVHITQRLELLPRRK